jgi:hypothetical protein
MCLPRPYHKNRQTDGWTDRLINGWTFHFSLTNTGGVPPLAGWLEIGRFVVGLDGADPDIGVDGNGPKDVGGEV